MSAVWCRKLANVLPNKSELVSYIPVFVAHGPIVGTMVINVSSKFSVVTLVLLILPSQLIHQRVRETIEGVIGDTPLAS